MWRFDGRNVKSNSFTPYFLINLSLRFFNSHISCSPLVPPPHIGIGSSSPSLNAIVQASGQLSSTDWKSPRLTQSQTNRHLSPGTANLYRLLPTNRRTLQPSQVNKKLLRFQKQSCIRAKFKSFEFTDLLIKHSSSSLRVVIVYRPPPSKSNKLSLSLFFEEFPRLLEDLTTASGSLLMAGDFNFHVDDAHDSAASRFLNLLEAFGLKQNVSEATHRSGHTLDLIITRPEEDVASHFSVFDPAISDHSAVSCKLSLPKTAFERREVCYRKLKSIDIGKLREDIENSPLADPVSVSGDLNDLICQYNTVLSELLEKHAPLKKRMITLRPAAPWYTDAIRTEKRKRRKLERRWRASGLTVHRELYVDQCKLVNKCIFDAKMGYYSALIEENDSDPKKLFSNFDKVLHRKAERKFSHSDDVKSLANAFADYFTTKISNIREELQLKKNSVDTYLPEPSTYSGVKLCEFKSVTTKELHSLISGSSLKSCALDPIPAPVLKSSLDLLLPFITKVVNSSLAHGVMADDMKEALLKPLLKKASLDYEIFRNYRPVSNLMFLSKCCEKVVSSQLNHHLRVNNLEECFQSAYKAAHSTESALVRVHNDILCAIDEDRCVILLLLDLSAAFDTVDHQILLSRLSSRFGIDGMVLSWFKSYLCDRRQSVSIENERSSSRPLTCGVPQGSVLGPILYLLYTAPLGDIMRRHDISYHMYADDMQIYLTFKSSVLGNMELSRERVEGCVCDIHQWMVQNNLMLNNGKTELLILHSKHRPQPSLESVVVADLPVVPTQSARNLGVVFDNTMNFEKHISEICKSAFFHIRNISQVRRYLSIESTKTLIHALVTSRIDNCNALLYGLPSYLVQRLQYVLNSAARLIFLSRKADHITPLLINLHWLPVEQRINFKIMLLTYKIINGLAPSYLSNLLVPYVPRRALRSADKLLLSQPSYHLKSYGFRAFSICAPSLWNKLPINIKCSQSVGTFKRNLKTYLFRLAYY